MSKYHRYTVTLTIRRECEALSQDAAEEFVHGQVQDEIDADGTVAFDSIVASPWERDDG